MKEKIYYLVVFILCIVSVILSIMDFTTGLSYAQRIADQIIYWFFVADYIIRLVISNDKKDFAKDNIFDLLAIIPFNSAFRAFRLLRMVKALRFAKILRFTKLFRVGSLSGRLLSRSRRFFDTNGFKYVLLLSVSSVLLASFSMMHFEGMQFTDALWWSFVTATTVGYGDLSPATTTGRIIAALLMIVGIGLLGSLTSTITSFFLRSKNNEINNNKIDMVKTLYDKLSDEEKKIFLCIINEKQEDKKHEGRGEKTQHQKTYEGSHDRANQKDCQKVRKSSLWRKGDELDPKKAAYNKVYNETSVSVDEIAHDISTPHNHSESGGNGNMDKERGIPDKQSKRAGCGCIAAFVIIAGLAVSCSALLGGNDNTGSESTTEVVRSAPEATTESQPSAYDRIDQILHQAEADADSATKKDFSTAASYINKHVNDFQNNSKAMESMVYYGLLLYHAYDSGSKTSDMGYNAAEAARLVYAGESDIDSTNVQTLISNVETDLNDMYAPTTQATTETASQEFPTEHIDVDASSETTYIINISSKKFHLINGPDTYSIALDNRQETTLSREELIEQGYEPCGRCFK